MSVDVSIEQVFTFIYLAVAFEVTGISVENSELPADFITQVLSLTTFADFIFSSMYTGVCRLQQKLLNLMQPFSTGHPPEVARDSFKLWLIDGPCRAKATWCYDYNDLFAIYMMGILHTNHQCKGHFSHSPPMNGFKQGLPETQNLFQGFL